MLLRPIKKENVDLERQVNRYSLLGSLFFLILWVSPYILKGQISNANNSCIEIDYSTPKKYVLGGIAITGTKVLDPNALVLLTGLTVGSEINIPGDKVSGAIKNLWKQGLFSDISISVQRVVGNKIYL